MFHSNSGLTDLIGPEKQSTLNYVDIFKEKLVSIPQIIVSTSLNNIFIQLLVLCTSIKHNATPPNCGNFLKL